MRYVLGIDAGGTKTVGLLADEQGRIVAEARGSGSNLQTQGELEVEKVFDGIIETLGRDHTISAVCLGIAGVDRPHDEAVIRGILRRLGYRDGVRVVNDGAVALAAGAPARVGIVGLAGTGSIAFGADRTGQELALTARAVHRQIDLGHAPFPVVLAGGVFKACPTLAENLSRHLDLPGAQPTLLAAEPATGAVALALDLLK